MSSADIRTQEQASTVRRWLLTFPRAVPMAIFLVISAITAFSIFAIESNVNARENAQIRQHAQSVASNLERRGNSFAAYLRAGAALFANVDEVTPQAFSQFVSELRLDLDYKGAEGIGWIEAMPGWKKAEFIEAVRRDQPGFPRFRPEPTEAQRNSLRTFAPVLYASPDTARNQRALGFDMYSDPARAAAMEEARRTVRPTASSPIIIAQDGAGAAKGFEIFMPVYQGDPATREFERSLAGFVYSSFSASKFLDSAIDQSGSSDLSIQLFDSERSGQNLLVDRRLDGSATRSIEQRVTIADRDFVLLVEDTQAQMLAPLSMVTLLFGLASASLLTVLARFVFQQAQEDQRRITYFEQQNSIRDSLTRELNHRVKNTLANVLSILSLTRRRSSDLDDFADSLEGRIRALSATHDLLTGSEWGATAIRDVVEAEMRHARSVGDSTVVIDGPSVLLAPNDALSFGLAIHELATNAAKFGALSAPGGEVTISWTLVGEQLAEVEWQERGGPVVASSRHRGFGTELIEKIIAHELKQPVDLDFAPGGVRCVMRVPIRRRDKFKLREGQQAAAG